jgi:alkylation response protein AidB-like acyl-CoA dehydrogenase
VRDFVDREVKPVVRDLEHNNIYPEKLIEQMKQLGIYDRVPTHGPGEAHPAAGQLFGDERVTRGRHAHVAPGLGNRHVAKLLLTFGTQEQKDRYLP